MPSQWQKYRSGSLATRPRGHYGVDDATRTQLLKPARSIPEHSGMNPALGMVPVRTKCMTTTCPRSECAISLFRGCRDHLPLWEGGRRRRRGAGCSLGYYVLVLGSPVSVPLVMAWQASRRAKPACQEG